MGLYFGLYLTDGIDNGGQVWNGIRLQRVGGKERCYKSDGISGNFGGVGSDFRPLGGVRMKIVSHCRRTTGWVYDQCRFEPKRRFRLKPIGTETVEAQTAPLRDAHWICARLSERLQFPEALFTLTLED
jgi:hypothetical protein